MPGTRARASLIVKMWLWNESGADWKLEFSKARKLGLKSIEWTLDYKNLEKNPLLNKRGQSQIKQLSKKNLIKINSITGDCFMQKPFWKKKNNQKLHSLLNNCIDLNSNRLMILNKL